MCVWEERGRGAAGAARLKFCFLLLDATRCVCLYAANLERAKKKKKRNFIFHPSADRKDTKRDRQFLLNAY